MRKEWRKWREADIRTPQGNLKQASRQDVINWVSRAWSKISEEVIKKSFRCCGISLDLDGSQDAQLSDNMADALGAADRMDNLRDEAMVLLFESDDDSDLDFDGFGESDIDSD